MLMVGVPYFDLENAFKEKSINGEVQPEVHNFNQEKRRQHQAIQEFHFLFYSDSGNEVTGVALNIEKNLMRIVDVDSRSTMLQTI